MKRFRRGHRLFTVLAGVIVATVVVALHDATVDRITGTAGSLREMTFEQLSELDAGWSFTTGVDGSHPFRDRDVKIPTFESILDGFPDTLLSVDLKDEALDMVEPVCSLLRDHGRFNDVFVGSNSDARATNAPDFVPAVTVDQPPFRIDGQQLVDADSLAWAHQHGIAILTWVVNDVDDMKLLVDLGVDGIYTSYPNRLLKILGRCSAEC